MSERFAWIYDKTKGVKTWCADMWSRRAILALQTTVNTQATTIATQADTIAAQAQTIATLQSNYTALEARVAALEGGTTT